MLPPDSPQKKLAVDVAKLLHSDNYIPAGVAVRNWVAERDPSVANSPCDTTDQATVFLHFFLHWLLENDGMEDAAQVLWTSTKFTPLPAATQAVWKACETQKYIMLMGAASQSKSFSVGVKYLLEFLRDPEYTTIRVLGPSEGHLEANLFSHLVDLHQSSSIPLPGKIGKLFIGLNPRRQTGSIMGLIVPVGKRTPTRLRGVKRVSRSVPHPKFGPLSRLLIFLDEVSSIPPGIWSDIDNVISNDQKKEDPGLQIIGAFNPTGSAGDEVGMRCEPRTGWGAFDLEKDFEWMSRRGWYVVRLDAAQSENVKENRVIYPGFQTYDGYQSIIKNSGGLQSPGYFSMCRASFPPTGVALSVVPQGFLLNVKATPHWYERPRMCAGVDLALQGSDSARFALGEWGLATSITFAPSLAYPTGNTVIFKDERGRNRPRYVLALKQIFKIANGNTIEMTESVISLARRTGVAPDWMALDRTGNGQGVVDLIRHFWDPRVIGLNFTEGCSEQKMFAEDREVPKDLYDRAHTELAFGVRRFLEFGYLKFDPSVNDSELSSQLTSRQYLATGKKVQVESKDSWKSRHAGMSPDEADSLGLLVWAVRKASGETLTMDVNSTEHVSVIDDEDDFYGPDVRISTDNKFEDLDADFA